MKVKYKNTLDDFEIVRGHHLFRKNEKDIMSPFVEQPGYAIHKVKTSFFGKRTLNYQAEINLKTLKEVAEWLSVETGVSKDTILDEIEE